MSAFRLVTTFVLFCVVAFGDLTTFFGYLHLVTTTSKEFWFGIIIKITTTIMRVGPGLILNYLGTSGSASTCGISFVLGHKNLLSCFRKDWTQNPSDNMSSQIQPTLGMI